MSQSGKISWINDNLQYYKRSTLASILIGKHANSKKDDVDRTTIPHSLILPDGSLWIGMQLGRRLGDTSTSIHLDSDSHHHPNGTTETLLNNNNNNNPNQAATAAADEPDLPVGSMVIIGGPAAGELEQSERYRLRLLFTFFAFINACASSVLFFYFQNWSIQGIQNPLFVIEGHFSVSIQFSTSLLIILFGTVSIWMENPTLITIFLLLIPAHFFIFISRVPYFIYAARYILDFGLFVIADNLRTRQIDTWTSLSAV